MFLAVQSWNKKLFWARIFFYCHFCTFMHQVSGYFWIASVCMSSPPTPSLFNFRGLGSTWMWNRRDFCSISYMDLVRIYLQILKQKPQKIRCCSGALFQFLVVFEVLSFYSFCGHSWFDFGFCTVFCLKQRLTQSCCFWLFAYAVTKDCWVMTSSFLFLSPHKTICPQTSRSVSAIPLAFSASFL